MSRRSLWMLAAGALAFAACGEGSSGAADGEHGGLDITVHDMTETDVVEMHIDIVAAPVAGNRAVTQPPVVLTPADVNRTATGGLIRWEYTETDLPIGDYLITVKTYDATGLGTLTPSFESDVVAVTVTANTTTTSHIFLKQEVDDGTFVNPIITAVNFEKKPEFDKVVPIKVQGTQGQGVLSLTAEGDGDFGTAATSTWDGKGTGDAATTVGGAGIDWLPEDNHPAPNTPGNQTVKVTLTDELGNETSLTMQVYVDYQRGDLAFEIRFNHAPSIVMETKTEISQAETVVRMRAGYADPEYPTENVSFTWDLGDCLDKNFVLGDGVDTVPFGTWNNAEETWTGTRVGNGTLSGSGAALILTLANPDELDQGANPMTPSCTVTVTVEDQGLYEVAGPPNREPNTVSKRTQRFVITAGWVAEDIDPNP